MDNQWLTPQDLQTMNGLGSYDDRQSQLALQQRLAASLRQDSAPKGQMAGQVYLPPSALETAMKLYGQYEGAQNMKADRKSALNLTNDKDAKMQALMARYFNSGSTPAAPNQETSWFDNGMQ